MTDRQIARLLAVALRDVLSGESWSDAERLLDALQHDFCWLRDDQLDAWINENENGPENS